MGGAIGAARWRSSTSGLVQALFYRGLKPPGESYWSPPGDPSNFRGGANFSTWKNQVVSSPVGVQSLPYDVGSNGPVLHSGFAMWF